MVELPSPNRTRADSSARSSVSVVFITHDVADGFERTLSAVRWADEIVVLDSGSTDGTRELAERFGAKVMVHSQWKGFGFQKNLALSHATGDWILLLDADEVVDPSLAEEIRRVTAGRGEVAGYALQRANYFCGVRMRRGPWRPAYLPRLFQRERGRVTEDRVHERVVIEGPVRRLSGPLHHYTSESFAERVRKNDDYAGTIARERFLRGERVGFRHLLLVIPLSLLRDLILRLGVLDGKAGLIVAAIGAFYAFSKYAKLWELQQRAARGETVPTSEPEEPPAVRRSALGEGSPRRERILSRWSAG
jgi:glycosyltransferase involved in cell wall biosynthesis